MLKGLKFFSSWLFNLYFSFLWIFSFISPFFSGFYCFFIFFFSVLGLMSDLFSGRFSQVFWKSIQKSKSWTHPRFFLQFFFIIFFFKSVFFRFFLSQFSFRFFPVEVCRSNWRKNKLETKLKKLKTKPNIKLKKTHKISNQTKNNWRPNSRSNWKKLKIYKSRSPISGQQRIS